MSGPRGTMPSSGATPVRHLPWAGTAIEAVPGQYSRREGYVKPSPFEERSLAEDHAHSTGSLAERKSIGRVGSDRLRPVADGLRPAADGLRPVAASGLMPPRLRVSRVEIHELAPHAGAADGQEPHRDRQREAAGSDAAGVHEEHAVLLRERGLVGVPGDDGVDGRRLRVDGERLDVVEDVEPDPPHHQDRRLGQRERPRAPVVVPAHGRDRRHRLEGAEHLRAADVARVHDPVDAAETLQCLRAQEPVCI